jgi:hypothetical protein
MTISVVQSTKNASANSGTLTLTLGSATTAGNCLVVCISEEVGTTSGIKIGGAADNFAKAISILGSSSTEAEIWTDQNCVGGQTSVVITLTSSSSATAAVVYEVSGLLSTLAVDKTSTNSSVSTGTSWTSNATATTTQANEIYFGCFSCNTNGTITGPSSPWTNLQEGPNQVYVEAGYQIASSTGTPSYAGTISGDIEAAGWACAIVTLIGSSSGSATSTPAPVQPGKTWTRRFKPHAQHPLQPRSSQSPTAQLPQLPVQAGRSWKRRFRRQTQHLNLAAFTPGTNVSLPAATVTITANPVGLPVFLATATITIATPVVTPVVDPQLPVATVTISAPVPGIAGGAGLPVATVTIGTPAVGLSSGTALPQRPVLPGRSWLRRFRKHRPPIIPVRLTSVQLPAATVTIGTPPVVLPVYVALATATVTIGTPAPTVHINVAFALPVAAVTIQAYPVRYSRPLIVSLASQAGTDDYGNSFPEGILATAGVIEGPEIIAYGTGSVFLAYSPSPGAGNMITSIAPGFGSDAYGNAYLPGTTSYFNTGASLYFALSMASGAIAWYTSTTEAGPWTIVNSIGFSSTGEMFLSASSIQLGNLSTPIPISGVSGSIATLPNDTNSGTTWVSGERAFMNNQWVANVNANFTAIINALVNAGIIT